MVSSNDIEAILRLALPEIQAEWPIRSLAPFGSRIRGDATTISDLDMLVAFERPVPLSSFLPLERRLGALTGLRVDLVSDAALKPYIGARVRSEAVPL